MEKMNDAVKEWGKLVGFVIGFLIPPIALIAALAAFSLELKEAIYWAAIIFAPIYVVTGILVFLNRYIKKIARQEARHVFNELSKEKKQ